MENDLNVNPQPQPTGVPTVQLSPAPEPTPPRRSKRVLLVTLAVVVLFVLAGLGGWFWLSSNKSSDNAALNAAVQKKGILGSIADIQKTDTSDLQTAQSAVQSIDAALSDHEVIIDTNDTVAHMKEHGADEINRRLGVLGGLRTKMDDSKNLSDLDRQAMVKQIDGELAGLPKLAAKINSDTTVDELRADIQSIYTEYRVYRLILPKAALLVANDRLAQSSAALKSQVTKIDTALAGAKAKHQKVAKLQTQRNDMMTKINKAVDLTADISSHVRLLTPEDWNHDRSVIEVQRAPLAQAKQYQDAAADAGKTILAGLAKLPVNPTPNIVFVLSDDQSLNLTRFMPNTNRLIGAQGASFSNYFDNISLCCAARASIMRGQYAHNSGVQDNDYPHGGFERFYELGDQKSTVATWLHDAGYSTALMGKYLNGYPRKPGDPKQVTVADTWIPPGWDDWFVPVEGGPYSNYNYTMNDNGVLRPFGHKDSDYMVDVLSDRATDYITQHKDSAKPYFMYIAPYSPHSPYTPAPRYANTENNLTYPHSPNFDEADVSDKPSRISGGDALTQDEKETINADYRLRAEDMHGIDDLVTNIYKTLQRTGQLDNTYIVFTTDNGYHMGEHRLGIGKYTPYEEDIHLPLYVRGPGIQAGTKVNALSGNIDLASTFADLGGAKIPSFVDGKSLVPYLHGNTQGSRKYYLLERAPSAFEGVAADQINTSTQEPADPDVSSKPKLSAFPFQGVRTNDGYVYVRYGDGEQEFYDLNNDPYELNNLLSVKTGEFRSNAVKATNDVARTSDVLTHLTTVLPKLSSCSGTSCGQ